MTAASLLGTKCTYIEDRELKKEELYVQEVLALLIGRASTETSSGASHVGWFERGRDILSKKF